MPNNSYYYGLREETTSGTAVKPWPRPGVVKERPRRRHLIKAWAAWLFPGKYKVPALFAGKPVAYSVFDGEVTVKTATGLNTYLLSDDMIAHSEDKNK